MEPKIQELGRRFIIEKNVAIIGIGALGSVVSKILAERGVKNLTLVDRDVVSIENLKNQRLFSIADVGKLKVMAAKQKLDGISSDIFIEAKAMNLYNKNINEIKADLIIDCTDNIETKLLLNEYAVKNKIPLVHGAIGNSIGQLFNVIPNGPCIRCIFNYSEIDCSDNSNDLSLLIGTMQANEAIKILLNKEYEKKFIRIDFTSNKLEKIKVNRNKKCPVCNGTYEFLDEKNNSLTGVRLFKIEKCKTRAAYTVKPTRKIKLHLENIKKKFKTKLETPIIIVVDHEDEIVIHDYGEIVFKKLNDVKKIEKIANEIYEAGLEK